MLLRIILTLLYGRRPSDNYNDLQDPFETEPTNQQGVTQ